MVDDGEDMTGVERCRPRTAIGVLPLMVAKEVASKMLLNPPKAHAAKPTDVTDKGEPVLSYGLRDGAVPQKVSDLALAAGKVLKREVSPPTVVLASALASELGSRKPIIEKVAFAKSLLAHAKVAGKRPFAYLAPKGVLGQAGRDGRVLATDKPPTFEDLVIAERVLGGIA